MAQVMEDGSCAWPAVDKPGWLPKDLDLAAFTHRVAPAETAALLDLADRFRASGKPDTEVSRTDFSHPDVDSLLRRQLGLLLHGPGLVFLTGLPHADRPLEDIGLIYRGIGTHFGTAVSQNRRGDLLGQVRVQSDVVARRAYGHAGRLFLHTDRIDMLSLFCVAAPRSGGASLFASGLAIWDAVARERPDLFAILERGFRQNRLGEHLAPGEESTAYRVPVFGRAGALRSILFSGNAAIDHQRKFFEPTPREEEALNFLAEVRDRPEFAMSLTLAPGEAVFVNNHEVLHGRETFEDGGEGQQRLLLRLWLEGIPVRPKPAAMTVMNNPSGRQGIDPRPAELIRA